MENLIAMKRWKRFLAYPCSEIRVGYEFVDHLQNRRGKAGNAITYLPDPERYGLVARTKGNSQEACNAGV